MRNKIILLVEDNADDEALDYLHGRGVHGAVTP